MIVGFTGTREGLTSRQHESLKGLFEKLLFDVFIHRGGNGSDTLAHYAVRRVSPTIPIFIIPSSDDKSSIVTMPLGNNYILQSFNTEDRIDIMTSVVDGMVVAFNERRNKKVEIFYSCFYGVPIVFVWSDGEISIERNEL
jgi:hypothetical protein